MFSERMRRAGIPDVDALSSRSHGELVTNHRSSWVRKITLGSEGMYVKTYSYKSWKARIRGAARNTGWRPSRVRREADALRWLTTHGFPAPPVLAVVEKRRFGLLVRGVLVTAAWPGDALSSMLPSEPPPVQQEILRAVVAFVDALHATGYRDRNLDLRNLLARPTAAGWEITKIDAPRFRLVPPNRVGDPLARQDWQRLDRSLQGLGLADSAVTDRAR